MGDLDQSAQYQAIRTDAGADFQDTMTITSVTSLTGYTVFGWIYVPGISSIAMGISVSGGGSGNIVTFTIPGSVTSTLPPVAHYKISWTDPSSRTRALMTGPIFTNQLPVGG